MEDKNVVVEEAEVKEVQVDPEVTKKEETKDGFGKKAKAVAKKGIKIAIALTIVGVSYLAGEKSGATRALKKLAAKTDNPDPNSETTKTDDDQVTEES